MGIFFGGGSWETQEERLMSEYWEDVPVGAPCKSDFEDEFRTKIERLKNNDVDLSELSADDIKRMFND